MAEYTVTDPASGREVTLTGDSPPTEQELEQVFAAIPKPQQAQAPGMVKGTANELLQGATFGFSDEIQAVIAAAVASPFVSDKTFSQLMIDARNSLRDEAGAFRKENPKTALAANVAGGLATGGAAGMAKLAVTAPIKAGAAAGAVAGAGFSDSKELISLSTAIDTAVGGAVGGAVGKALPKAINVISREVKRRLGTPQLQVFDNAGQFTDEALSALDDMVKTGKATANEVDDLIRSNLQKEGILTPEQAGRFNLFVSRDVTPTRANLTQSADDFSQQQSALKRSGPVADTVAKQDAQLTNLAVSGAEKISPRAASLPEVNTSVFNAVNNIVTRTDELVSQAYKTASEAAKGQPRVILSNLAKAVSDNRGSENVSGGVISSLRGVLKNKGLITQSAIVEKKMHGRTVQIGGDIDINKRGARITEQGLRKLTVKEAEEVRQHLNSLYDSVTPQGRRLIRQLKDAIDDDVAGAVGDDVFKLAREGKSAFHKMIERGQRNKFDKTSGGFLEDVIDNKIPEEQITRRLLGGRDDDFMKFKGFLNNDAGPAGREAWNDIRAQVLRGAIDKATSTMGKGEGGQGVFNVRLFKNELKRLQDSKKYPELFNTDERKLISDIIEIGNLRIPVSTVQQGKGPTELAVNELRKGVLKKIPIIGDKAVDLVDAISNMRADRRLLDVTRETSAALRK